MEKLRETELEMKVSICKPEHGEILGEDEEWRSVNYWDSSEQHTEVLPKEEDTLRSYVFNYNNTIIGKVE